ncbi:MAG: NAD(P)-binding protein [Gammaproteobacteria bacterium]|nr:NAD(P)-binding protein [Gammaproteobacteria bacterium]
MKVIVIGVGAAGLSAARELHWRGMDPLVLEAAGRQGADRFHRKRPGRNLKKKPRGFHRRGPGGMACTGRNRPGQPGQGESVVCSAMGYSRLRHTLTSGDLRVRRISSRGRILPAGQLVQPCFGRLVVPHVYAPGDMLAFPHRYHRDTAVGGCAGIGLFDRVRAFHVSGTPKYCFLPDTMGVENPSSRSAHPARCAGPCPGNPFPIVLTGRCYGSCSRCPGRGVESPANPMNKGVTGRCLE